jgi:hypothetical protein
VQCPRDSSNVESFELALDSELSKKAEPSTTVTIKSLNEHLGPAIVLIGRETSDSFSAGKKSLKQILHAIDELVPRSQLNLRELSAVYPSVCYDWRYTIRVHRQMLCSMQNIERVLASAYETILGKQGLGENTIKQSMYMGHYVVDHFRSDWKAIQRNFCDSLDQEGVSLALKLPEEFAANRWLSVAQVCQNFVDIFNIPALHC